jgi:excisionase family DNA binding protein
MAQRFLLTRREAAEALGVSLRHFQRHVQPHLPCVYSGQLRLYRPQDLERWAEREAHTADEERSSDERRAAGVGA